MLARCWLRCLRCWLRCLRCLAQMLGQMLAIEMLVIEIECSEQQMSADDAGRCCWPGQMLLADVGRRCWPGRCCWQMLLACLHAQKIEQIEGIEALFRAPDVGNELNWQCNGELAVLVIELSARLGSAVLETLLISRTP